MKARWEKRLRSASGKLTGAGCAGIGWPGVTVSAGRSRYAMILWVKPKDFARASRVLGAR